MRLWRSRSSDVGSGAAAARAERWEAVYGPSSAMAGEPACHVSMRSARPHFHRPRRVLVVNVFVPPLRQREGATRVVANNVQDLKASLRRGVRHHRGHHLGGWGDPPTTWSPSSMTACACSAIRTPAGGLDGAAKSTRRRAVQPHPRLGCSPTSSTSIASQILTATVVEVTALRRIPYVITAHDGWWISPPPVLGRP